MDMKKVANIVSVILNLVIVFPLISQFALFAIFYHSLNTERLSDYYNEILTLLPISPPSFIIIGVVLPFIFAQALTTVTLRLLLKYISKDGK